MTVVPDAVEERIVTAWCEADYRYRCEACGFTAIARVASRGVHIDPVPFGHPRETSVESSQKLAVEAADEQAHRLLRATPCPRCKAAPKGGHTEEDAERLRRQHNLVAYLVPVLILANVPLVAFTLAAFDVIAKDSAGIATVVGFHVALIAFALLRRDKRAAALHGVLGSIEFGVTRPPQPPRWARQDRLVYRVGGIYGYLQRVVERLRGPSA